MSDLNEIQYVAFVWLKWNLACRLDMPFADL